MQERRKAKRFKDGNEVTITPISEGGAGAQEKIICSQSKDISVLGTKIQVNYFVPVNSLIQIDFTLKDLYAKISAIGKVKWIKSLFSNETFEAGIEFVTAEADEVEKREHYIAKIKK